MESFEIKFHNPKARNACDSFCLAHIGELIDKCQDDEEVKVIMLHGGKNYSSGNDLAKFIKFVTETES